MTTPKTTMTHVDSVSYLEQDLSVVVVFWFSCQNIVYWSELSYVTNSLQNVFYEKRPVVIRQWK